MRNPSKGQFGTLYVLACLFVFGCASGPHGRIESRVAPYHSITLEDLVQSLPTHPIAVGFDIDDTVFFSSPGFYYGLTNKDGPRKTNKYGNDFLASSWFWKDMNTNFEKFSLPKTSARKAIRLHLQRGDHIFFITARPKTPGEKVTQHIQDVYDLHPIHPVIFTGGKLKTEEITKHQILIFYGDSDSDIQSAQSAKIRPIRFLRAKNSEDPTSVNIGAFGEEVLKDSDF